MRLGAVAVGAGAPAGLWSIPMALLDEQDAYGRLLLDAFEGRAATAASSASK